MLPEAIAALYEVFAGYPLRDWTEHGERSDDAVALANLAEYAREIIRIRATAGQPE
jgi:hypothetical protein